MPRLGVFSRVLQPAVPPSQPSFSQSTLGSYRKVTAQLSAVASCRHCRYRLLEAAARCSDGDCCLASWIGDGHCDGVTQEWDCDLSCYDDDGGDCAPPTADPTAAPIDSQFYALEPDRPETQSYETVEFFIASSLCLASVSAAGVGPEGAPLQGLVDSANTREEPLSPDEHLLLLPPEAEEGDTVYGKACTDNWNAVFRDKDEVTY
mgnify:CR=1 FL=1